jgi:hypothetical protein
MLRSRLGLKALILFGILASLSAFSAAGAQATPGAHWWLVKPTDGKLVELNATAAITSDTPTVLLLTKIAGVTVVLHCTTVASTGVLLEKEGSVSKSNGGFDLKFGGCVTLLNGSPSSACEPSNEGKEKGVILTKQLHGLIVLHELAGGAKDHLVQILPVAEKVLGEDKPFATIEMGAECAIGTKVNIIGELFLKECSPQTLLEHLEKHLLEEGPLTKLFVISLTAEHAAKLDGSVWALLTGEHKDWKFSGTTL